MSRLRHALFDVAYPAAETSPTPESDVLRNYFKSLYDRTMQASYGLAHREMAKALEAGGHCLDCGAGTGQTYDLLHARIGLGNDAYHGIEWNDGAVQAARQKGLDIIRYDLNKEIPHADGQFSCVFGLSVLEHLLNPCRYLGECHRVLDRDGTLIILTPNISTYFTAALILAGKMPSSGPHPDSNWLLQKEELFRVSSEALQHDAEQEMPVHRHLVVFSYRVLKSYLQMLGFQQIQGYGFGLYPFPNILQPVLEKIDPYHCHQMVFVARK